MVKSWLTVTVERSVTEESNWKPVGDLAGSILRAAAESRGKLVELKAAVARDHADALPPASGAIWVQLDLPLVQVPSHRRSEPRAGRISRL
jgi:hypothetical protein